MRWLAIVFIGISFYVYAAKDAHKDYIRVEAQVLVNGKVVSNPRIVAPSGERAEITQGRSGSKERIRMGVLARRSEMKIDEIFLDLDLNYMAGDRLIRSAPQVYVKSGVDAIMTLEESSPDEKIQLKVMARPVVR